MKKKIKKNRLKIFIALTLMFTLITTIFIGTKTFAKTDINNETYYEFNQLVQNGNFPNKNGWNIVNNTSWTTNNNELKGILTNNTLTTIAINTNDITNNHYYYVTFDLKVSDYTNIRENRVRYPIISNTLTISNNEYNKYNFISKTTSTQNYIGLQIQLLNNIETNVYYKNIMCFDLTKMFGAGNEPTTINEINTYFNLLGINLQEYQNYTTSKNMYISNNSNTDYSQLNNDYTELEDNYNTLEDNYNNVKQNYNNLNEVFTLGAFAFMKEIDLYFNYSETEDVILNSQQSKALLTNSTLDIYNNIYKQYNETIEMYIYFENLNIQYIDFSFVSPSNNDLIELYLTDGTNGINISKGQQDLHITYEWLLEQNNQLNDNYKLEIIRLNPIYTGDVYNYQYLKSNSPYQLAYTNGLNRGYNNGYNNAKNQYQKQIEELQNAISEISDEIIARDRTIQVLREQLEAAATDYNLNNLMWTIAGTPFESFKQIWDLKFFGVNVSELVLGLITTFIALNIAKRFFF